MKRTDDATAPSGRTTRALLAGDFPFPRIKRLRVRICLVGALLTLPGLTLGDDLSRYEARISALEADAGVFDPQLGETLAGYAAALVQAGRTRDARDAYERALQVQRVAFGLYSAGQLPLLVELVSLREQQGDWDEARALMKRVAFVAGRCELPLAERIDRLVAVAEWHFEAVYKDPATPPFYDLRSAQRYLEKAAALEAAETPVAEPDDAVRAARVLALDNLARAHSLMAAIARRAGSLKGSEVRAWPNTNSREVEEIEIRQRILSETYQAGREALETALALVPESEPTARGARYIRLGDWKMEFRRRSGAEAQYQKAWAAFLEGGASEDDLVALFAQPVPLPVRRKPLALVDAAAVDTAPPGLAEAATEVGQTPEPEPEAGERFLYLKFAVKRNGRARDPEVVAESLGITERMRRDAKEQLRRIRFRPKLVGGLAEEVPAAELRFLFPPEVWGREPLENEPEPTAESSVDLELDNDDDAENEAE